MAKRKKLEEQLEDLNRLAGAPLDEVARQGILDALASPRNILVAKAARIATGHSLAEAMPALLASFDRFLTNPVKTDPGCLAKRALVEALVELEGQDHGPCLKGIRHVQLEPSYGRPVDTADHLRAASARALYAMGYHDLLFELTDLLTDDEVVPRTAAVDILAAIATEPCELLLRLKAQAGDAEPEVMGACFSGLLAMSPERSVAFVAHRLDDADLRVAEEAALALGETHREDALQALVDARRQTPNRETKDMYLLPIALTRQDGALAYLLDVVDTETMASAVEAVSALQALSGDPGRREVVRQAVEARGGEELHAAFDRAFDADTPYATAGDNDVHE